ncbi:response regulator transcription factor [Paenibacillus thalictri]|uniref:Response regulator n=1 Tax=Paenibacillus thalictri TaxID=2527873 RepID=A0A4Q9DTI1_9BACL|nr:response regulator [Paenibacillus thalictri]TBL78672.1 response regulator [Paenibacillus thalictri]
MTEASVLIVDDEIPIRESMRMFPWAEHGFRLAGEARHGREALELIESSAPDILITDIMMPVMDGISLMRKLQEREIGLPVILLTCHKEFDYVREALLLGAKDYLVKGIYRDQELLEALNKARKTIPSAPAAPLKPEKAYRLEVSQAIDYVIQHKTETINLTDVAAQVGLSVNYFGALFRKETGEYFQDYVKRIKLEQAAELLKNSTLKVYEIAEKVGMSNYRYFTEIFCKHFGKSPREYRSS